VGAPRQWYGARGALEATPRLTRRRKKGKRRRRVAVMMPMPMLGLPSGPGSTAQCQPVVACSARPATDETTATMKKKLMKRRKQMKKRERRKMTMTTMTR
jgi:hypothetical protein